MLAFVCSLVFASATFLAVGTIIHSIMRYGPQISDIVGAARSVPDLRDVSVWIVSTPGTRPAVKWMQLRRQPRRSAIRVSVRTGAIPVAARSADGSRAAA